MARGGMDRTSWDFKGEGQAKSLGRGVEGILEEDGAAGKG